MRLHPSPRYRPRPCWMAVSSPTSWIPAPYRGSMLSTAGIAGVTGISCFRTDRSARLPPAHQGMKSRLVQRIGTADSAIAGDKPPRYIFSFRLTIGLHSARFARGEPASRLTGGHIFYDENAGGRRRGYQSLRSSVTNGHSSASATATWGRRRVLTRRSVTNEHSSASATTYHPS